VLLISIFFAVAVRSDVTDEQSRLDSLLITAAKSNRIDLASDLIDLGAKSVHDYEWSALHFAAFYLNKEMFSLLSNNLGSYWGTIYEERESKTTITMAALLGGIELQKEPNDVVDFLKFISIKGVALDKSYKGLPMRTFASQLGYDDIVLNALPYQPLPVTWPQITIRKNMSVTDWTYVQSTLSKLDLYRGEIDGILGPETKRAVFSYYLAYFRDFKSRAIKSCETGIDAIASIHPNEINRSEAESLEADFFLANGRYIYSIKRNNGGSTGIQKHGYSCASIYSDDNCKWTNSDCWDTFDTRSDGEFTSISIETGIIPLNARYEAFKIRQNTPSGPYSFYGPSKIGDKIVLWGDAYE
jgi:hypothetical protein